MELDATERRLGRSSSPVAEWQTKKLIYNWIYHWKQGKMQIIAYYTYHLLPTNVGIYVQNLSINIFPFNQKR